MSDDNKVVFLSAFVGSAKDETLSMLSCGVCKNKTYSVVYDGQTMPYLKCAACGQHHGRIGWSGEDA